jgi:REP element-mobilizing transposase RayT
MPDEKGTKRLRAGRRSLPNQSYLITTTTATREKRFANPEAARFVLTSLHWLDKQGRIRLDAAVVMPDHVHFVAALKSADLPQLMHSFKSYTSNEINKALNRQGPVWQRGYHDHAIRREEDLNETIMYVLNNPVRAGMTDDFHKYPHWYCRWAV